MNHHSFKSSYNYLIFGTLRPSSFYSFYQEKWYPYRKLISRCKCSCLSVSLALNACACNRWPDFTWRPPAISFSVFQNSLGSRQIIFLPGTYHCSYFRVTCWIYYSNKFYDFNFDETLYQIQWLVRWFYEKKKISYRMWCCLKCYNSWSTAKILSLLLDDMCQLSTKHGYVNELPIKTVL